MPFQRSQTLSSGLVAANAYGEVTNWNLQGRAQIGLVEITWWKDKAAHDAGMDPIATDQLTLTYQEQQTGRAQLLTVIQNIITARPAYAGTTIV